MERETLSIVLRPCLSTMSYVHESRVVTGTCPESELTTPPCLPTLFSMTDFNPKPSSRALPWRILGFLLLAPFLSTCSDSTGPIFTFWEGTLEPVRHNVVGGQVVAVTQHGRTDVGISLEDGDPGTTYGWRVDSGTCDQDGTIQGGPASYPLLLPGPEGSASAEAIISALFKPGKQFSGRVFLSGEGASGEVVACGEMEETTG